jgi:hypothetical protein
MYEAVGVPERQWPKEDGINYAEEGSRERHPHGQR